MRKRGEGGENKRKNTLDTKKKVKEIDENGRKYKRRKMRSSNDRDI